MDSLWPISLRKLTQIYLSRRWMQWGIIMGMGAANERRRYYVTLSLIGRAHTQTGPCGGAAKSGLTP